VFHTNRNNFPIFNLALMAWCKHSNGKEKTVFYRIFFPLWFLGHLISNINVVMEVPQL